MVANPYAAGNNVYNGGSSAATVGQVGDPSGYIDRSVDNGGSAPNQYTPGVAASALNQLRDNLGMSPVGGTAKLAGDATATPAPITQADATGQISWNMDTWHMPIDYDLQMKGINAGSAYQDANLRATASKNSAELNRTVGERNLDKGQQNQQRVDLGRAAGRGMARSSGYMQAVDNTAQNYGNQKADLEARFYQALNTTEAQQVQAKQQYDQQMQAIYEEAAARIAQKIKNGETVIDPITGKPIIKDTPGNGSQNRPPVDRGGSPKPGAPKVRPKPKPTPSKHQQHVAHQKHVAASKK